MFYVAGLYLVGEKGEKGLPGPPGRCDCDRASNAPFGSYTQRGGPNKVPAVRNVTNYNTKCFFRLNRQFDYSVLIITHQLSLVPVCMSVCRYLSSVMRKR